MDIYQNAAGQWIIDDAQGVRHSYATYQEAASAAEGILAMERDAQFIEDVEAANKAIWDGINKLVALQRQWNALDYANTLAVPGVTAADVGAVVFDTADAFVAVLSAGHATNMAKLL